MLYDGRASEMIIDTIGPSAATFVEASIVVEASRGYDGLRDLDRHPVGRTRARRVQRCDRALLDVPDVRFVPNETKRRW